MELVLPKGGPDQRERALNVLLSNSLEPIVDLVAWSPAPDRFEVASAHGHLRFSRDRGPDGEGSPTYCYSESLVGGENPVARQDASHLGNLADEMADPHPTRRSNSYPHAFEQVAQLFDHPSAPDLVVLHSASHYWGDQGGHLGEHGSLGVVQARAPFIVAGAGVQALGMSEASCRLVDVAPTVLELLGCPPPPESRPPTRIRGQDGEVVRDVVARPGGASRVVAFLLDGTNPNVLYDLARRGEAPNVARLMEMGTAYGHGAIASLPTVTLANHTAILTGRHPGHHGILHNAWIDRASGNQVVTNSPSTWSTSMSWLSSGVETIHDAVHRGIPGSVTISINEPCDVGADYSIFDLMRSGEPIDRPPPAEDLPDATTRFVRPSKDYRWSSLIDHTAVEQFCGIWGGSYRGRDWPVPTFSWMNFTLTDAAFHEGGPYSEIAAASVRDTDRRIGHALEAVERAGVFDETAFIVVADHGMQLADPSVTGDWDVALAEAGVPVRDEGYGFLYL
jgi:hypothetical protein